MKKLILILITLTVFFSCTAKTGSSGSAKITDPTAKKYIALVKKIEQLRLMGGKEEELKEAEAQIQEIYASVKPLDKYDPPITLEGIAFLNAPKFPEGEDKDHNRWLKAYEDKLGIKVVWQWFAESWDTYMQKINITIASGSLPDYAMAESENFQKLWNSGMVQDLHPYWFHLRKEVRQWYEDHPVCLPALRKGMAYPGFPELRYAKPNCYWIRKDWLDNLGLEGPKKYEDVFKIAKAFAKQDPDGNGQDDTLGAVLDSSLQTFLGIFYAHGAYPLENHWIKTKDNKLAYGAVQPEVKTTLEEILKYQEAGLLDEEWPILTLQMCYEDLIAGRSGLYLRGVEWNPIHPLKKNIENFPEAKWACYDIIDTEGKPAKTGADQVFKKAHVINKNYEHPEVLFKMANLRYELLHSENQELYYHTDMETDTQVFPLGLIDIQDKGENQKISHAIVESLNSDHKFEGHGLDPIDKKYFDGVMEYLDGDLSRWDMWMTFGPDSWTYKSKWYMDEEYFNNNAYYGPTLEAWIDKGMTLERLRDEAFVTMLADDKSLEGWDAYVKKWFTLGGQQATEEANQWWEDER